MSPTPLSHPDVFPTFMRHSHFKDLEETIIKEENH